MRTPTQARYHVTVKTVLAGLGIALLSACSGSPTGPSAPQVERSSIKQPAVRSNMTGYVVAENAPIDGQGLQAMGQQILRRVPVDSLGSQQ